MNNSIKFSLVLLYCFYFGFTSAADISCIKCNSEFTKECISNAVSLTNNTDLQVTCGSTCFTKKDGDKIVRGCSSADTCVDASVAGCKVCDKNNCNIDIIFNCYDCTDDKDNKSCSTLTGEIKDTECTNSCVQYLNTDKFVVRGCLTEEIAKNCPQESCKTCDGDKCNKDTNIVCKRCRGDFTNGYNCNYVPSKINDTSCDDGYFVSSDTKCYSRQVGSNTFRGCVIDLSDNDLRGKCFNSSSDCQSCVGSSCNTYNFNGAIAITNKNVFLWTLLISFSFTFLYK